MDAVSIETEGHDFMDLEEFRMRVGMGRTAVYQAAREGRLPLRVHRFGRRYLISRVEYDAMLRGQHHVTTWEQVETEFNDVRQKR